MSVEDGRGSEGINMQSMKTIESLVAPYYK